MVGLFIFIWIILGVIVTVGILVCGLGLIFSESSSIGEKVFGCFVSGASAFALFLLQQGIFR